MFHFPFHSVSACLRTPKRRLAMAVALSALIHGAILWLPYIHLPHSKVYLPPLTVRLEPLPKSEILPAAVAEPTILSGKPGNTPSTEAVSKSADTMKKNEQSATKHLFPEHLEIIFAVYEGADTFSTGEIQHQLDIRKDRYTLKSVKQTIGLTSLLSNDRLTRISYGKIGELGLQPETFNEDRDIDGDVQSLEATFDWATRKIRFSHGGETALPADAQDVLSFMYQLSQLPMDREIIPLSISDGNALEQLEIEVGIREEIVTPMGNVRAWHLRQLHAQGEAYFEIWLGLEYRLLPVKFRLVGSSGEILEELVVSSIQTADE